MDSSFKHDENIYDDKQMKQEQMKMFKLTQENQSPILFQDLVCRFAVSHSLQINHVSTVLTKKISFTSLVPQFKST